MRKVILGSGAGSRDLVLNFGTPSYFRDVEARDLKFCVPTGEGPNRNYAKVSRTGTPYILVTAAARDSSACYVCGAFDAVFAKLAGLLLTTCSKLYAGREPAFDWTV